MVDALTKKISKWLKLIAMTDEERYLSRAKDIVELERRIKNLPNRTTLHSFTGAR